MNKNNSANEVVKLMTEELKNSGINITVGNCYTSYNLSKDFLNKNLLGRRSY